MAYCSNSTFLQLIDNRLAGDLCSDTGTRITPAQLLTDPNLTFALSVAAGQINSAALYGQRYTVAQLGALTSDDAAFLAMLNAWIAFGILCGRRGRDPKEHPEYTKSLEAMELLRKGDNIFNVPADVAVGTGQVNFPSITDLVMVNSLVTSTQRYYPTVRPQQVPPLGT